MAIIYLGKVIAALAILPFAVHAQTYSSCNPMKNTSCPANPAMLETLECDFTTGESALEGWKITAGSLTYADDGANLTIKQKGDAPTIQTNGYLFFGRAEVKTKAASGQGIISSIVLQSDDLDEVDWEFLGGVNSEVQTNYFGKGNTTSYDRAQTHPVTTPQQVAHTYIVDWTAERINFYIDDTTTPVRTLNYADAVDGTNYPQTPMNLRIGIWAGGDKGNAEGTIEWAGGLTDYTKAPFTQVLEYVKVTNYSPGKEYVWKDESGSYESIEVVAGDTDTGSPSDPVDSMASSTVTGSTTAGTSVAAGEDGTDGLGGQGHTSAGPGEFYPTGMASLSYTPTITRTVTGSSEPTIILPSDVAFNVPTSLMMDTGVPYTALPVSTITTSNLSSSTVSPSPGQFTGGASTRSQGMGGAALMAGAMGALFL